jgi:hypothetical protein
MMAVCRRTIEHIVQRVCSLLLCLGHY